MRCIATLITLLYAVTWTKRIDCGDGHCENYVVDASNASDVTVSCPALSSCRNMTLICPIGNETRCEISCTDSFSCDIMTIYSQSTATVLNCISPNITKTNICTNDITLNLSPTTTNVTVICTGTNVTVCDSITVNTHTTQNLTGSNLYFHCEGDSVRCDALHINTPNIENVQIVLNGSEVHLNGSRVITNHNIGITMDGRRPLLSMSTFMGPAAVHGSSVTVTMANDSISRSNTFIFNDLSTFTMVNGELTQSNINITNAQGRLQTVRIKDVNADGTNTIGVERASVFSLVNSGSLGTMDVMFVEDVAILITDGIDFSSTINAQNVFGVNMTVLEGGVLNGIRLNVQQATQVTLNIYGQTRGKNLINAITALGLDIFCNNPKSCGDDLGLWISPRRTTIHCVGTGCDRLTLTVAQLADEVAVDLTYCPCEELRHTLCITEWDIICENGNKTSIITNGQCTGECCGGIVDEIQETFSNPYECPLANETTYICQSGTDCVIDCANTTQYNETSVFACSSNGSMIDASHAQSLTVQCGGRKDAACAGLNVRCPNTEQNSFTPITCHLNCTEPGACADVTVNTLRSGMVHVGCLVDGSCAHITVDNTVADDSFNHSSNSIMVECMDGLCKNINVIGGGARVFFVCTNCTYGSTNITNEEGYTQISMKGENSDWSESNIWSEKVRIFGEMYTFTANVVRYNAMEVVGDGMTVFRGNVFTDYMNNTYAVSLNGDTNHQNTSGIFFTAENQSLVFGTADSILLVLDPTNSLTAYTVRVVNPSAEFSVYNNAGDLTDVVFDAKQIQSMSYMCGGLCRNNRILVDNAAQLNLIAMAENVLMDGRNTEIFAENLTALNIGNVAGNILNFNFNFRSLNTINVSNQFGGVMSNISLNARDVSVISGGFIDQLYVKGTGTQVIVDVRTLTNSLIYAKQIQTMNYTCGGVCYGNNILVDNATQLNVIAAENAVMDGKNGEIFAVNLKSLNIGNFGGNISNFNFSFEDLNTIHVSNRIGGVMSNISLIARDVVLVISEGIMDQLYIKGIGTQVMVNVTGTLHNSWIDGTNTTNLSVICSSDSKEGHCANVTFKIGATDSPAQRSSLLCRNLGCQNLSFYTVNDIDDMDISLTDCPCALAINSSCIQSGNQWNIYCDASSNGEPSVFVKNKCDGKCCGQIVDELKVKKCDYPSGGHKTKNKADAIVGAVCGVILFGVMVGAAVYYVKKKKRAQQEAEALLVNA